MIPGYSANGVRVTRSTRAWGLAAAVLFLILALLFLPVWAPLFVMYRVAKATKPLVKGLAIRLVQTDRYGVPGHNGDTKNNPLGFSAVRFGWKPIKPELFASLKYLLAKNVRERWFNTLNVIILVSGLLTTSSYQAIYADLAAADDPSDKALADWFRVANVVSFLASIATITCSTVIMLALNRYVVLEQQPTKQSINTQLSSHVRLKVWCRVLVYYVYRIAMGSFYCSVAAALASVGLSGPVFLSLSRALGSTVVVWGVLLVTVMTLPAGLAMFIVEPEDQHDQTQADVRTRAGVPACEGEQVIVPQPQLGRIGIEITPATDPGLQSDHTPEKSEASGLPELISRLRGEVATKQQWDAIQTLLSDREARAAHAADGRLLPALVQLFQVWSGISQVGQERNPYPYVPASLPQLLHLIELVLSETMPADPAEALGLTELVETVSSSSQEDTARDKAALTTLGLAQTNRALAAVVRAAGGIVPAAQWLASRVEGTQMLLLLPTAQGTPWVDDLASVLVHQVLEQLQSPDEAVQTGSAQAAELLADEPGIRAMVVAAGGMQQLLQLVPCNSSSSSEVRQAARTALLRYCKFEDAARVVVKHANMPELLQLMGGGAAEGAAVGQQEDRGDHWRQKQQYEQQQATELLSFLCCSGPAAALHEVLEAANLAAVLDALFLQAGVKLSHAARCVLFVFLGKDQLAAALRQAANHQVDLQGTASHQQQQQQQQQQVVLQLQQLLLEAAPLRIWDWVAAAGGSHVFMKAFLDSSNQLTQHAAKAVLESVYHSSRAGVVAVMHAAEQEHIGKHLVQQVKGGSEWQQQQIMELLLLLCSKAPAAAGPWLPSDGGLPAVAEVFLCSNSKPLLDAADGILRSLARDSQGKSVVTRTMQPERLMQRLSQLQQAAAPEWQQYLVLRWLCVLLEPETFRKVASEWQPSNGLIRITAREHLYSSSDEVKDAARGVLVSVADLIGTKAMLQAAQQEGMLEQLKWGAERQKQWQALKLLSCMSTTDCSATCGWLIEAGAISALMRLFLADGASLQESLLVEVCNAQQGAHAVLEAAVEEGMLQQLYPHGKKRICLRLPGQQHWQQQQQRQQQQRQSALKLLGRLCMKETEATLCYIADSIDVADLVEDLNVPSLTRVAQHRDLIMMMERDSWFWQGYMMCIPAVQDAVIKAHGIPLLLWAGKIDLLQALVDTNTSRAELVAKAIDISRLVQTLCSAMSQSAAEFKCLRLLDWGSEARRGEFYTYKRIIYKGEVQDISKDDRLQLLVSCPPVRAAVRELMTSSEKLQLQQIQQSLAHKHWVQQQADDRCQAVYLFLINYLLYQGHW